MSPSHKRLLIACAAVLVAWALVFYFVVWPRISENRRLAEGNDDTRRDLQRQGVTTTDPVKLAAYRESLKGYKREIRQEMRRAFSRSVTDSQFGSRIKQYETLDGFRRTVNTLAYQEAFLSLKTRMADDNHVNLYDPILGLNQDTYSNSMYQFVAHLWVLEDLINLAKANHLDLADRNFEYPAGAVPSGRRMGPPARITAMPVVTYKAGTDAPPYLEEYPVRLTVRGSLKDVCKFILDLTAEGRYIPLRHIALARRDISAYRTDEVEATLICSGFLILSDDVEKLLPVDADTGNHNLPPWQPGN